jgi:hypothetical protein
MNQTTNRPQPQCTSRKRTGDAGLQPAPPPQRGRERTPGLAASPLSLLVTIIALVALFRQTLLIDIQGPRFVAQSGNAAATQPVGKQAA